MFNMAIYALPLFAAVSAGRLAFAGGAGWLGAIILGLIAGGVTLGVGQLVLASTRSSLVRLAIALVFAVPAAFAGHSTSATGHETAVTGLGLHVLGLSVWVGGLMALALLLPVLVAGTNWQYLLTDGPFGIEALNPVSLFGTEGPQLTHGVLWSLGLNLLAYLAVSLARPA